jgi:signal transduction histidine kinase
VKPRSLRVRLLLGAAVAIFAALAAAWAGMTLLFERHIERRVVAELTREGLQLAANVVINTDGTLSLIREPADVRFSEPTSGLYWQVSTPNATLRSRSLWDQDLPPSSVAGKHDWSKRLVNGPYEQRLLLLERIVRPEKAGGDVLLQLGHERESLQQASAEFGAELAMFLALLWLILSAAAWAQVQLGLRPLRRVREQLEILKRNPRERLDSAHVSEVEPLTHAINELADAREHDLQRARRRAADLAHGLKTPLAALSAQSRRARAAGASEAADGLDRAIAAAAAAVESELARSRAAAIRNSPARAAAASKLIESIIEVIEHTDFGARLVFDVDVSDELRFPVAEEDFLELLGALIENAARFARRRVRISSSSAENAMLSIEDDGPGIDSEQMSQAISRGGRLDEAGSGHGLGLAIAHELIEATRGRITLLRSDLGGLKVTVSWATSAPPP